MSISGVTVAAGKQTKEFSFVINAGYAGGAELKKLRSDLEALGKVESARKLEEQWRQTNLEFATAKQRMRELREAMRQPGGAAFAGAYARAKKEVSSLSARLREQRGDLDRHSAALKKAGIDTRDLAGEQKRLQAATRQMSAELSARKMLDVRPFSVIREEISRVRNAYAAMARSGKLSAMEQAVAFDRMQAKVGMLKSQMNGWTSHLERMQQGWAGLLGVVAGVAGAGQVIGMFSRFDDTMRQVAAVSGATEEEFARLRDAASEMGRTTRFSAVQAAEGLRFLSMAGFDADKAMASLPGVLQLASAGAVDLGVAADIVTNIMSGFRIEAGDLAKVNDVLVAAFTSSNSTLTELGSAFSYVGPIAKSAGQSFEETVAILAKLHDAGIKGERAGTALRGAMARLARPTRMVKEAVAELGLEVKGSDGKMRSFIDILGDLEKKGADTEQVIKLFGQEAGPGMAALLGLGTEKLREYEKSLHNVGGTAERIADQMEQGIGGSLRKLKSAGEGLGLVFGDAVAPAISAAADGLAVMARLLTGVPEPVVRMTAAAGLAVTALAAWELGLRHLWSAFRLAGVEMKIWSADALRAASSTSIFSRSVLTLKGSLAALGGALVAWDIGTAIGRWANQFDVVQRAGVALSSGLTISFLKIRKAWAWVTGGDTAAIQREIDNAERIYSRMFAEIGRKAESAGKTVTDSHKKAAKAARESADDQKQVTGEALEEMKKKYKQYVDEVKRLQQEIADKEVSLQAKLRAMARTGMSDLGAWRDRKREAMEYEKVARKAIEAGDFKTAAKYAGMAEDAYADLNREVKKGDKVLISSQAALREAMKGVERAGRLAVEALSKQEEAAKEAARALDKESGGALSAEFSEAKDVIGEVKEELGGIEQITIRMGKKWVNVWQDNRRTGIQVLDELQRKIDQMDGTTIRYYVEEVQRRMAGGMIHRFATGGRLPGYGGGDRIPALLEAGEFIIRKEAVARFGAGIFHALNNLRLPEMPRFSTGGPVAATGTSGGQTINVNLNLGGDSYPMQTDPMTADRLLRDLARKQRLRSS